ncbi:MULTISPECIES: alpha/beta hydrolase, partial [unclassified Bradyrhizobium]|uniref:alpha/beta fold hydrolase n=1 Tax=unclassified Bradyrhizobium TaxID=2631580 RepID=UPI002916A3BC
FRFICPSFVRADSNSIRRNFLGAGQFEAMQTRVCTNMTMCELIDGAGHWVQQEQPESVNQLLLRFMNELTA